MMTGLAKSKLKRTEKMKLKSRAMGQVQKDKKKNNQIEEIKNRTGLHTKMKNM